MAQAVDENRTITTSGVHKLAFAIDGEGNDTTVAHGMGTESQQALVLVVAWLHISTSNVDHAVFTTCDNVLASFVGAGRDEAKGVRVLELDAGLDSGFLPIDFVEGVRWISLRALEDVVVTTDHVVAREHVTDHHIAARIALPDHLVGGRVGHGLETVLEDVCWQAVVLNKVVAEDSESAWLAILLEVVDGLDVARTSDLSVDNVVVVGLLRHHKEYFALLGRYKNNFTVLARQNL